MNGNITTERTEHPETASQEEQIGQAGNTEWQAKTAPQEAVQSQPSPWFSDEEVNQIQSRWKSIQIEFVDEPRTSVEKADELVADALERLEQAFAHKRTVLDEAWINHEDISTEELRIAMKNYHAFLDRLLEL